jgi:glycerophosphoryl diester phosphodiesterase
VEVFTDTPVLCGHRGSGRGVVGDHRENTLDSFLAAAGLGLRWVEVDARLSADGVLVARHDPDLEDGRLVGDLPAGELDLMRVADLFEALPPEVAIDVDIKSSLDDALRSRGATTAARVAELLAGAGTRRVLATSFDPASLLIVREIAPDVALGLLTWTRFPLRKAIAAAAHLGVDVVIANVESFPGVDGIDRSVAVAHEAGLQVGAWCPAAEQEAALIAAGVDCLVVDEVPDALTRASRGRGPSG